MNEFKEEADGVDTLYKTLQNQIELLQEKNSPTGDKMKMLIELEELHLLSYQHFEIFGKWVDDYTLYVEDIDFFFEADLLYIWSQIFSEKKFFFADYKLKMLRK